MEIGAFRGVREVVWSYLFDAKKAAGFKAPPAETFVYVWAPDPGDPRHWANGLACARIVGDALHDDATDRSFPIVDTPGAAAIVYDRGEPKYRILDNWFYDNDGTAVMYVDAEFAGTDKYDRLAPWRTEAVERNVEMIRKADEFMPVLAGDGDTTAVCAWLRSRPETPPGIIDACATLDEERKEGEKVND
jgi:hypothetical protein